MSITLDGDGAKDLTLDASAAQALLDADGGRAHPGWLILRGTGTAVDVVIDAGGVVTDAGTPGSAGERSWTVEVPAKGSVWEWIGGTEAAISGSAATAISIATV